MSVARAVPAQPALTVLVSVAFVVSMLAGAPAATRSASPEPSPAIDPLPPDAAEVPWYQVVAATDGTSVLYGGALGGPTWVIARAPTPIRVSGPSADGEVLAWWRDGRETVVAESTLAEGDRREVARLRGDVAALSLAPDGGSWYWVATPAGGGSATLRRQGMRSARRPTTRVVEDLDIPVERLTWLDDAHLVLEAPSASGADLRVVDVRTNEVRPLVAPGPVIGPLGDELAVFGDTTQPHGSIVALDPTTGARRPIVIGEAGRARTRVDALGPGLVWEGRAADGTAALLDLGVEATEARTRWAPGTAWAASTHRLLLDDVARGVAAAGSVALYPDGSLVGADGATGPTGLLSRHVLLPPDPIPGREPPAPPVGLAWRSVAGTTGAADELVDVAASRDRLVALGRSWRDEAWRSVRSLDGGPWTSTRFPVPEGEWLVDADVAANGRALVAVAIMGGQRVGAWWSQDGRRWARARLPLGAMPQTPVECDCSSPLEVDVATIDGRFTAMVRNWSAERRGVRLWTSTDGAAWRLVSRAAQAKGTPIVWVLAGRNRLLGSGPEPTDGTGPAAYASSRGRAWYRIGSWPSGMTSLTWFGETDQGLVVMGFDARRDFAIWTSPDARTWTEAVPAPGPWSLRAVTVDGDRVVAVGSVALDGSDVDVPGALVSLDGGRSWVASTGWIEPTNATLLGVDVDGQTVIAVGQGAGPGRPPAWRGAVPE